MNLNIYLLLNSLTIVSKYCLHPRGQMKITKSCVRYMTLAINRVTLTTGTVELHRNALSGIMLGSFLQCMDCIARAAFSNAKKLTLKKANVVNCNIIHTHI